MNPSVTRRHVVVTGAANGIGRATVELLAGRGHHVTILDRDVEVGTHLARHLADGGASARFIACDVGDPGSIENAFRGCEGGPSISGLVNNAGSNAYLDPLTATPDEWDAIFALNVRSAWLCSRAAVPLMDSRGGAIVNVASIHAARTVSGLFPYAATKSALLGLTRGLALELARYRIRVNALCPGWTRTSLTIAALNLAEDPAARRAEVEAIHPVGRIAEPPEIAATIAYLLSPDASFVNGTELYADGGLGALSPA